MNRLYTAVILLLVTTDQSITHAEFKGDEEIFDPIIEINLKYDARLASQQHKHLMIMFVKDGCTPCLQMKKYVLSDPEIHAYFLQYFNSYQVNIFGDLPLVDEKDNTLTEKIYAKRENIWGTPAFYFFGEHGQLVYKHTGALSKADFISLGEFVRGKQYLSRKNIMKSSAENQP